jgi:hypothetical protein
MLMKAQEIARAYAAAVQSLPMNLWCLIRIISRLYREEYICSIKRVLIRMLVPANIDWNSATINSKRT